MAKGWLGELLDHARIQKVPAPRSSNVSELLARAISVHQAGRLAEAKTGYDQVLEIIPDHFDALHLSGVVQYQRGQYAEAVELIGKAIEISADQAPPYSNLGLALHKLGRLSDALSSFNHALTLQPDYVDALFNRGNAHRDLRRFEDALDGYDRAIELRSGHPDALNNRGLALVNLNRPEEALDSFDKALAISPGHVDALINRGTALCAFKRYQEALASFDRVIALNPADAKAHSNRGAALAGLSRHQDALASYGRALEIDPCFAESLYNQAATLSAVELHEASLASYDQALACKVDYPEAFNGRGTTLRDLGRYEDALASYDRALAIRPDFPEALDNRGVILAFLARHREALASHDHALALRPEFSQALSNRATALREIGEQSAAELNYRAAVRADPTSLALRFRQLVACIPVLAKDAREIELSRATFMKELRLLEEWTSSSGTTDEPQAVGAMQPFHLAYQEENNRELLTAYGALCSKLMAGWQERNSLLDTAPLFSGRSRVRLGIVSAHVHNHSVWSAIVKGWLQHIDKRRFEVEVFYLGGNHDEQTAFAKAHCDRFESGVRGLSAWAKTIKERQPDVLIYPEVGMDITTPRLASMRLAPIQIAAWGHPETTGFPTIDYYLSAELFETQQSQECYAEKLIRLPNLGCHYSPENVPKTERNLGEFGIDPGSTVFICPGTPFKYASQHDVVFVDIARRIENARFVFFNFEPVPLLGNRLRERLAKSFEAANIDYSRFVTFVPWQAKTDFYALLRQADVFLDTIGFSGFNTAMQAIECGLPIVTREGRFMRGKFASAILKRINLAELVADSHESYVDIAVRLARDQVFNSDVRERIRNSRQILYGDAEPITALEDFLTATLFDLTKCAPR